MRTEPHVNQTFLNNMAALWRLSPPLAQQIDELPFDASLQLHATKAGPPTAAVASDRGRTVFLHSRYDPLREARDFAAALENRDAACILLCGLGLGYHLKALFEQHGDQAVLLVAEPDLVTIKTALEHTDLSRELSSGRVELVTRCEKSYLHERLTPLATMLMLGTVFAVPLAARDHAADFHAAIRKEITDYAAFAKMSLVTLVRNSAITCRNIANNLPTYVATPPCDILLDRFKSQPAILVAAGPSLQKNLHQLRELGGRAVIIAAQTTLRPLLDAGITPHFVTSLDFCDLSRQFFENLALPDEVVLVAEPKASWHVIDTFRRGAGRAEGRVILLDNLFARRCLGDELARRTPMEPGATVMHLAFYLAQWLGCDPIIFIGQDLAFGGHCYYAPGVAIHRAWRPELGRYQTLEMKEWERIGRHRPILRRVQDAHGRAVYTDDQMFTYLQQFERDFARCAARVIDATEGGALKKGATPMPLVDAIAQFCTKPIPRPCFDYLKADWRNHSRLAPARMAIDARRRELADFRDLCEATGKLLAELKTLVGQPTRFNERIARVDELRTLVKQHDRIFQMVRDVAQLGELQRIAADRTLPSADDGPDRARRQLERDEQFISAMLGGCDQLQSILDEALARFDESETVYMPSEQPS